MPDWENASERASKSGNDSTKWKQACYMQTILSLVYWSSILLKFRDLNLIMFLHNSMHAHVFLSVWKFMTWKWSFFKIECRTDRRVRERGTKYILFINLLRFHPKIERTKAKITFSPRKNRKVSPSISLDVLTWKLITFHFSAAWLRKIYDVNFLFMETINKIIWYIHLLRNRSMTV